ncbi:hypothetical protein EWE75_21260 [Sphingomonas populi]|uniref:Uncharacterized protein n=1 Tax=Sphingomonas populi TaxID=2484750 RepID=A0A4Q6XTK2_9SPHN|nr:hypothetical protein [Sphingomonas populi]RZF60794.1 hypothetical protein EWE75_21260 [Sphingomonas populi]
MIGKLPRRTMILVWLVGYLWSVPLAMFLSSALDWQYDGNLGWWIMAAYTSPILLLTEPLRGFVPSEVLAVGYLTCLLFLTLAAARFVQLSRIEPNGN